MADSVCVVAEVKVLVKVAVVPLNKPVPTEAPLSRKVTVPVGVPAPGALTLTVTVQVTLWPVTEEVGVSPVTVLIVLALPTVWLNVPEVPPLKFVSPA